MLAVVLLERSLARSLVGGSSGLELVDWLESEMVELWGSWSVAALVQLLVSKSEKHSVAESVEQLDELVLLVVLLVGWW